MRDNRERESSKKDTMRGEERGKDRGRIFSSVPNT
jgi:hypothetical protein